MERLNRNQAIWLARGAALGVTLTATRAGNPDHWSDEQIYLVATRVDLRPWPPAVDVCVHGPRGNVCAAKTGSTTSRSWADARLAPDLVRSPSRPNPWRANRRRAPLVRADDWLFLIAPMEHLDGSPSGVCSLVLQAVDDAMQMPASNRNDRVSILINVMNRTIDYANGGPNFCSAIELGLTSADISMVESRGYLQLNKPFFCYSGYYNLDITINMVAHTYHSAFLKIPESSQQAKRTNSRHIAGIAYSH